MSGRYIDKIFQSDGAANDFYLDLCEEYKNVKIVDFAPWPDGRCHACFCVDGKYN